MLALIPEGYFAGWWHHKDTEFRKPFSWGLYSNREEKMKMLFPRRRSHLCSLGPGVAMILNRVLLNANIVYFLSHALGRGEKLSRLWAALCLYGLFFFCCFFLVEFYLFRSLQMLDFRRARFSQVRSHDLRRSSIFIDLVFVILNIPLPVCNAVSAPWSLVESKQWFPCGRNRACTWPPFLRNLLHLPFASLPRATVVTGGFSPSWEFYLRRVSGKGGEVWAAHQLRLTNNYCFIHISNVCFFLF